MSTEQPKTGPQWAKELRGHLADGLGWDARPHELSFIIDLAVWLEGQRWRQIETAPKDGTYFLVAGNSGYTTTPLRVEVCRYDAQFRRDTPWINHANERFSDGGDHPTVWMPLPDSAGEAGNALIGVGRQPDSPVSSCPYGHSWCVPEHPPVPLSDISALRDVLGKATPGPWYPNNTTWSDARAVWNSQGGEPDEFKQIMICESTTTFEAHASDPQRGDNLNAIAALRNAAPALLDEVERLREAERKVVECIGVPEDEDIAEIVKVCFPEDPFDRLIQVSKKRKELLLNLITEKREDQREISRLRILARADRDKLDEIEPFMEVLRDLDKRFGCDHTSFGPEDARQIIRHVDVVIDENTRLRKALERISKPHHMVMGVEVEEVEDIARQALAPEGDGK